MQYVAIATYSEIVPAPILASYSYVDIFLGKLRTLLSTYSTAQMQLDTRTQVAG